MFDVQVWYYGLMGLLAFAALGWLASLPLRNVSIVDSMWPLMFLLAAGVYAWALWPVGTRGQLALALVAIWSLRLGGYITWRNWGHGEDFRYQAIRKRNQPGFEFKSLFLVFGLQAVLAWAISMPLLAAMNTRDPLGVLDYAGVALWVVGIVFEAGGDWQLARFKANPANHGRVMDRGLWRYTRHPNYFGDYCVWWGLFFVAAAGGGWWSIAGPLLMSYLLLRISGVVLLEKDIADRRPAYRQYMQRTNAFFPGPPKTP